jgi:hypothetical protein
VGQSTGWPLPGGIEGAERLGHVAVEEGGPLVTDGVPDDGVVLREPREMGKGVLQDLGDLDRGRRTERVPSGQVAPSDRLIRRWGLSSSGGSTTAT